MHTLRLMITFVLDWRTYWVGLFGGGTVITLVTFHDLIYKDPLPPKLRKAICLGLFAGSILQVGGALEGRVEDSLRENARLSAENVKLKADPPKPPAPPKSTAHHGHKAADKAPSGSQIPGASLDFSNIAPGLPTAPTQMPEPSEQPAPSATASQALHEIPETRPPAKFDGTKEHSRLQPKANFDPPNKKGCGVVKTGDCLDTGTTEGLPQENHPR